MIVAEHNQSWIDQQQTLSLVGEEVAWLTKQRQRALACFENVGLPGIRDEQWRYTNLRTLKNNTFQVSSAGATSTIELPKSNNPRLVFIDGHLDHSLSSLTEIAGATFNNLADVLSNAPTFAPALLEVAFGSCLPKHQHGFTALNTAYCQDGYVLNLAKGTVWDTPLEVFFVASQNEAVSHTRNLIVAGANSQCTIIERYIGHNGQVYLNNTVTEIVAEDSAHIDHYKIQQESEDAFHVGGVFVNQAAHSQVKNHTITLSGLVTRNDTNTNLLGSGAHMEMNGLVFGQGQQHIDNHTEVNHAVPNCTSDEYYKTVLDDHSCGVFRGRIIVAKDAQLTSASQQNNNLLLSKNAEANTKPQLEIYADDVQCSHGATVGQLDVESLFYLKSRGINEDSARALLTFAFTNEVIERVNVESVRDELTQIIVGELLNGVGVNGVEGLV